VFTVTVICAIVERVPTSSSPAPLDELSIDELAARSGTPSRTIREYQTIGVLPPPERRGRTGVYGPGHLRRLQLIADLQHRGYSLAGIRDLLGAWSDGADLTEVLGLAPDDLVHLDEPGAPTTLEQLAAVLPDLVPDRLEEALAVGLVDRCGPDRYAVPSPSLLQLAVEMLGAGYTADDALTLLKTIDDAAATVADAAQHLVAKPPPGMSAKAMDALASRARGLLAHGTGRATIYQLGRRLPPDAPGRQTTRRR
jgi:DNA-binding transcriptional MerR regulator